ncbi:MAG: hypothetical protein QXH91_09570, partial [Candidatus Bathyarchaeia archaeon]
MSDQAPLLHSFAFEVDERGHEKRLSREAEVALLFSVIERKITAQPTSSSEKILSKLLKIDRRTFKIEEILKIF